MIGIVKLSENDQCELFHNNPEKIVFTMLLRKRFLYT